MKGKWKAKAASLLLSLAMVVTFIPFFGTQEAWAIDVDGPLTIDLTSGTWTTEDVNQSQVIEQFILDAMNDGTIPSRISGTEYWKQYSLDFNNDDNDEVIVKVDSDTGKMTIRAGAMPCGSKVALLATAERIAYYQDMSPTGYSPDMLPYYYTEIQFIIKDKITVKDSLTLDFTTGYQSFSGPEAAAIKVMLHDMSDAGLIDEESIQEGSEVRYWYDLNKDDDNEICLKDFGDGTISMQVVDSCSTGDFTLTAPAGWADGWAAQAAGTEGLDYVYRTIEFHLMDVLKIVDSRVIDLYDGVQTFTGTDALGLDQTLCDMAGFGVIRSTETSIEPDVYEDLYDLDKDENKTFDVRVVIDLENAVMTMEKLDTNSIKGPSATVEVNEAILEKWTSHSLDYFDGTTKVYRTITFNMAKEVTPTVVLSKSAFTYNGKTQKPTVTVKADGKKLTSADYTITNKGRKDVGKGTVKVTLKGNYSGTKTVTYKINPKGTTLKTPAAAKKAATVKWTKQSAKMSKSRISGYQIMLATDSKFTKNKKTVNVTGYTKVSKKVTGLKGGKKYYVKIRTYKTVDKVKYYSPWSKVKTVTTKK